ncbi:FKBP12-associated protein 1-like protein [Colletotrichum siamense]|uniref:FKBP12-associated protein 1-like protein n=1 Tax=Colletotrichum siamense TaxID=690259 RepID=UPI001872792E|nr:FKBP12-associated protein 1-like protein [Colletotrichum siamense]KAF5515649.1 FKBP12-associated protein 1-like protein [Colletotrichum siamense]
MSEAGGAQTQTQTQTQASSSGRGGRRGRSGRGRGGRGQGDGGRRGGGRNAAAQSQPQNQNQGQNQAGPAPASEPIVTAAPRESAPDASASGSGRRGRGRGGSRGGRRGGGRGGSGVAAPVPGTQRTFGGRLTTNAVPDENAAAGLSAAAPDFVPGQPVPQRSAPAPKQKKPQYPLAPKSTAADLPTRIHEDISHGQYDTHTCRKECHRPGECEDAEIPGSHCAQPCGKTRKSCEHACQDSCHAPYQCKEDRPCQSKTFITCECQNRKKEVKCLATKTNPTPDRDTLKCDDECLRLQRNQRLAAALNVDPDHTDDHIPYSDTTLKLFRELSLTWAQNQEREFRVFASEPSEKRLRFKPMPKAQRAFIHNLAADFGFDSESQDPEPHRHVSVFKTPRFVSAPKKTLSQCAKIRADAAKLTAAPAASSSANASAAPEPFNALLLTAPRFGLTIDEIDSALATHLKSHNSLSFTTSFLPSDEILIRAVPVTSWGTSPSAVESTLSSLKPLVARTVTKEGLAAAALLVTADANLNVLRREGAAAAGAGGWNAVVGRAAAQRRVFGPAKPETTRPSSGFVSFSKLARKKIVEDSVADDWEAAADDE